jgi:hypothetical protein
MRQYVFAAMLHRATDVWLTLIVLCCAAGAASIEGTTGRDGKGDPAGMLHKLPIAAHQHPHNQFPQLMALQAALSGSAPAEASGSADASASKSDAKEGAEGEAAGSANGDAAPATEEEREEVDARSIYIGNVGGRLLGPTLSQC